MEILKCDRCGKVYRDRASVESAKLMYEKWLQICEKDNYKPRGIAPCPILHCNGELILMVEPSACVPVDVLNRLRQAYEEGDYIDLEAALEEFFDYFRR